MKKILFLSVIIISIFLIFIFAGNKRINYVSIGDTMIKGVNSYGLIGYSYNDYVKNYLRKNNLLYNFNDSFYNTSIDNLTMDLVNNRTIIMNDNEYYLKKVLRESDLLVISIGMDELAYYFKNDFDNINFDINKMLQDIEKHITMITKYAKNKIIFIGYYNPLNNYYGQIDEIFYNIDDKLINLLKKYDISYLPLYEKIKAGNYIDNNNYHLNSKGYLMIANEIIKYIENM